MTHIDVLIATLGQTWRVSGMFTPSRPAITGGPPDNWEPADPAEWDEHTITLADGKDDLSELLEGLRVPGRGVTALDHILDMAELQWLRDQDNERREAA